MALRFAYHRGVAPMLWALIDLIAPVAVGPKRLVGTVVHRLDEPAAFAAACAQA